MVKRIASYGIEELLEVRSVFGPPAEEATPLSVYRACDPQFGRAVRLYVSTNDAVLLERFR